MNTQKLNSDCNLTSGANHTKKVIRLNISQFELTKVLYESAILSKCDLTPSAKLFLWALCSHYNPKNESMFPSQQTVSKKLGISEKSAQRAVKELKNHGLIDYETKRVNHYVFGAKFFELVKMSGLIGQNVLQEGGQNVLQTNNPEQNNEKNQFSSNFSFKNENSPKKYGQNALNKKNWTVKKPPVEPKRMVPNAEETRKLIEEREKIRAMGFNPFEYNREDALEWLKSTPEFWLKRSHLAEVLIKKYQFKDFLYLLKGRVESAPPVV